MTPEQLLADLEGLPHSQRVARMVQLGRSSLADAAIADCLSQLESSHGLYGKILALHAAHGSRDSAVVLRSFNSTSRTLRNMAIYAAPAVADDATVVHIWQGRGIKSEAFAARLRGKRRHLVDAHVGKGWPATADLLGSCSLSVVEELWAKAVGTSLASEAFPSVARCHPGFAVRKLSELSDKLQKKFLADAAVMARIAAEYPEETLAVFMSRPHAERGDFLWMPIVRKMPDRALEAMFERGPVPEVKEGTLVDESPLGVAARRLEATQKGMAPTAKLWRLCRGMGPAKCLELCFEARGTAAKVMRKLDFPRRRELFGAWKDWWEAQVVMMGSEGSQEDALRFVRNRAWALIWSRNPFTSADVVKYLPRDLRLEAVQLLAQHGRPAADVVKTLDDEQVVEVFRAHGSLFIKHTDLLATLPEAQKREAYGRWKAERGHLEDVCEGALRAVPACAVSSTEMRSLQNGLQSDPMEQAATMRLLPEDLRPELYNRCKHWWAVGPSELRTFPKEQRIEAARCHIQNHKKLKADAHNQRPHELLPYFQLLPWDEMMGCLMPWLKSDDAQTRAMGIQSAISSISNDYSHALQAMELIHTRKNERDSVREAMLKALHSAGAAKRAEAAELEQLENIISDAMCATDTSAASIRLIECICLSAFPRNPRWAAGQLKKCINQWQGMDQGHSIGTILKSHIEEAIRGKKRAEKEALALESFRHVAPSIVSVAEAMRAVGSGSKVVKMAVAVLDTYYNYTEEIFGIPSACISAAQSGTEAPMDQKVDPTAFLVGGREIWSELWQVVVAVLQEADWNHEQPEECGNLLQHLIDERMDLFPSIQSIFFANMSKPMLAYHTEGLMQSLLKHDAWEEVEAMLLSSAATEQLLSSAWDLCGEKSLAEAILLEMIKKCPKRAHDLIDRLVHQDPSYLVLGCVREVVVTSTKLVADLLTADLPADGRFDCKKLNGKPWVSCVQAKLLQRLTAQQQTSVTNLCRDAILSGKMSFQMERSLLKLLVQLQVACPDALISLAAEGMSNQQVRNTALALLASVDDPEQVRSTLLEALGDDRSYVASKYVKKWVLQLPTADALAQLDNFPIHKTAAGKQVVQILDVLSQRSGSPAEAAFQRLLKMANDSQQHKSVRVAILKTLTAHYHRGEVWPHLFDAAKSEDEEIAGAAIFTPSAPLERDEDGLWKVGKRGKDVEERVHELFMILVNHPSIVLRNNAMKAWSCANPPMSDPGFRMLQEMLKMAAVEGAAKPVGTRDKTTVACQHAVSFVRSTFEHAFSRE
eukprot:evm.model.scf_3967.1 EVM.evm.TU.scf_3967.1   scf_3967:1225-6018(+)